MIEKELLRKIEANKKAYGITSEKEYTCDYCNAKYHCPHSFDHTNIEGNCFMEDTFRD